MYSFTGATYPGGQSQALPGYSRFTPGPPVPACNSSLHSPGNNPLTLFTGNTPLIPPLPKRSQASVATSHLRASESPQKSQIPQTLHPVPQFSPGPGMANSADLSSPTVDPISPRDSLLGDAQEKSVEAPFFDFSGYMSPARNRTIGTTNSTLTSSYFTPSLPFPTVNSAASSSMYTPPIYPNTAYSQYYETNSLPLETLTTSQGISPYPALPYMPTRTHHKTLPKLSYDSPRFKLTPERAVPLIKWFDEHKDHPYPTRHEKILLCQGTQLTFTQVSTWFANARRRMKKASTDDEKTNSPESPGRSASPEEKSTVVVESTFSSAITVGDDEDTQDAEKNYEDSTLHTNSLPWDNSVY